jgi:hypothetical protein
MATLSALPAALALFSRHSMDVNFSLRHARSQSRLNSFSSVCRGRQDKRMGQPATLSRAHHRRLQASCLRAASTAAWESTLTAGPSWNARASHSLTRGLKMLSGTVQGSRCSTTGTCMSSSVVTVWLRMMAWGAQ